MYANKTLKSSEDSTQFLAYSSEDDSGIYENGADLSSISDTEDTNSALDFSTETHNIVNDVFSKGNINKKTNVRIYFDPNIPKINKNENAGYTDLKNLEYESRCSYDPKKIECLARCIDFDLHEHQLNESLSLMPKDMRNSHKMTEFDDKKKEVSFHFGIDSHIEFCKLKNFYIEATPNAGLPQESGHLDYESLGDNYGFLKIWNENGESEKLINETMKMVLAEAFSNGELSKDLVGGQSGNIAIEKLKVDYILKDMMLDKEYHNERVSLFDELHTEVVSDVLNEFKKFPMDLYPTFEVSNIHEMPNMLTILKENKNKQVHNHDSSSSSSATTDYENTSRNVMYLYFFQKIVPVGYNNTESHQHIRWQQTNEYVGIQNSKGCTFGKLCNDSRIRNILNAKKLFTYLACNKIKIRLHMHVIETVLDIISGKARQYDNKIADVIQLYKKELINVLEDIENNEYNLHGHNKFMGYGTFEDYSKSLTSETYSVRRYMSVNDKVLSSNPKKRKDEHDIRSIIKYPIESYSQDAWHLRMVNDSAFNCRLISGIKSVGKKKVIFWSGVQNIPNGEMGFVFTGFVSNDYIMIRNKNVHSDDNNLNMTILPVCVPKLYGRSVNTFLCIKELDGPSQNMDTTLKNLLTEDKIHVLYEKDSKNVLYHVPVSVRNFNGTNYSKTTVIPKELSLYKFIKDLNSFGYNKSTNVNALVTSLLTKQFFIDYMLLPKSYCIPSTHEYVRKYLSNVTDSGFKIKDNVENIFTCVKFF